jgi:threonine dehydrogenase-like Zn-dependent dehydrogenase
MKIIGFHADGGFQEYMKLSKKDEINIIKIPPTLTSSLAALSEPAACAIHQKKLLGPVSPAPSKVLIVGGGAMGILSAKLWSASKGDEIILIDINPQKVKIAANIGIDAYTRDDFIGKFSTSYFNTAIICCPSNDGLKICIDYLKKGGTLGFFSGLTGPSAEPSALNEIHYKELRIFGSYGCNLSDTQDAVKFLEGAELPDSLIKTIALPDLAGHLADIETDDIFTQIKYA